MALQIRRGVDGSGAGGRLTITPGTGELLYTTDTKKLYIGDGTTVGGNIISGGGLNNVVEDTSPQLGGILNTNGYDIISNNGVDININPGVGGQLLLNSTISIDGLGNVTKTGQLNFSPTGLFAIGSNTTLTDANVYITRNSYANGIQDGFTFAQHHETPDAVNFQFLRTRGRGSAPTAVLNGDDVIDIWFLGRNQTQVSLAAAMSVTVEGIPSDVHVPGKISFATNNGSATAIRAELSAAGIWKTNSIQNYSGTDMNISGTGTITATNAFIGNGASSPSAGTTLTITGTVSGGLVVGSIIAGGTTLFGTSITAINSATFASTISTTTLTVSIVTAGTIRAGMALSGGSVTAGTYIVAFVSGVNGGAGTYTLNQSATGTPTTGTSYTVSASQLVGITTLTSGGNVNLVGNVKILGQNSLRFADFDSSNYVAFKSPATVASNVTWTLPSADGTSGQVLSTNGSSTLSWVTPTLPSRTTKIANTGSVADATVTNVDVAGFKSYMLLNVVTSHACRVRIYTSAAARTADAGRAEGVAPAVGAGVIADIVATGAQSIMLAPGLFGHNEEIAGITTNIPFAITNKSGGVATIVATISLLQLEA
jgi:hypothetical protein